jgi:ABC-type glycerol-3-phosphate transport system substrate-binding protein
MKKVLLVLFVLSVTAGLFASGSQGGSSGQAAGGGGKFRDRVTLSALAFISSNEPDGRRSDPVTKYIEEKLNINLELTAAQDSTIQTQITAMIASNDLPDIFYFSNVAVQLPMLFASKSILNLEPYLKEWTPLTAADPYRQVMMEIMRGPGYSNDGNLYTWGLCKGSWDDGTQPTHGAYLQWDVYKKAGYPKLENWDDDLLDVMEAMVKAQPVTKQVKRPTAQATGSARVRAGAKASSGEIPVPRKALCYRVRQAGLSV